jgi:hypothetical protein
VEHAFCNADGYPFHDRFGFEQFAGEFQFKDDGTTAILHLLRNDTHGFQAPPAHFCALILKVGECQWPIAAEAEQGQGVPVLEDVVDGVAFLDDVGDGLLPDAAVNVLGEAFLAPVDAQDGKAVFFADLSLFLVSHRRLPSGIVVDPIVTGIWEKGKILSIL